MRTHSRIGKVTYKQSGLSVLPPKPTSLTEVELSRMHSALDNIFDSLSQKGVAGLFVVGIGMDMSFNRATRWHPDAPFGETLVPSFIAEILRRDISENIAHNAIDERLVK